ncbi:hypothetical protein [Aurantimonas marina]|uniref:hypothetical protein n=1 Tax=Aurantimonas marina TaxID=2780508 RepID=UPI0019D1A6EB|nr:hypothetical protein [Aurantimonas marina]
MRKAWIEGRPVSMEEAVRATADRIGRSRLPVITGLTTDLAGIHAAIALCRVAGGAIDHAGSGEIYSLISALRDGGMMLGAPAEIRRRADRVLIVGPNAFDRAPDLPQFLFSNGPDLGGRTKGGGRQALWLGASSNSPTLPNAVTVEPIDCPPDRIIDVLAMIRAALAGHRFGDGPLPEKRVGEIAAWLKGAGFGCAIFSPAAMDGLSVEMLAGLVFDLNAETRFTSLPVFGPDQACAAALATTWSMGFPLRTSFARGFPDHDPQMFEAGRLVASGEADLAIHVAALAGANIAEPEWAGRVPVVAVTAPGDAWTHTPEIGFEVALAGRDHDGALFDGTFGGFVPVPASAESDAPPSAEILSAIAAALGEAAPC